MNSKMSCSCVGGTCQTGSCGCGPMKGMCCGMGRHGLIRVILMMVVVIIIFCTGFKLGRIVGFINASGDFDNHMMRGSRMMMIEKNMMSEKMEAPKMMEDGVDTEVAPKQ